MSFSPSVTLSALKLFNHSHFFSALEFNGYFFRSNLVLNPVPPKKYRHRLRCINSIQYRLNEAHSSLKTHNVMNHCCRPVGLFRIDSGEFHLFILRVLLLLQPPPLPKRQRLGSLANECPDMVKWTFKYLLLFCAHGECPHRRTHKIFMVIKVECLFSRLFGSQRFLAMFGVSWLSCSWPLYLYSIHIFWYFCDCDFDESNEDFEKFRMKLASLMFAYRALNEKFNENVLLCSCAASFAV